MLKESKKMRPISKLKKVLNAKTKDEVIIKLLKYYQKSEEDLKKLEEIIDKCAYCSEELIWRGFSIRNPSLIRGIINNKTNI